MNLKNVWGFIKCLVNPSACQRTTKLLYEYVDDKSGLRSPVKLEDISPWIIAARWTWSSAASIPASAASRSWRSTSAPTA